MGRVAARMVVPRGIMGCLLGKGGKIVEQMREECRTQASKATGAMAGLAGLLNSDLHPRPPSFLLRSARSLAISCKHRRRDFSFHQQRQRTKKVTPDISLAGANFQQISEDNDDDSQNSELEDRANMSNVDTENSGTRVSDDQPLPENFYQFVNGSGHSGSSDASSGGTIENGGEIVINLDSDAVESNSFSSKLDLVDERGNLMTTLQTDEPLSNIDLEDVVGMIRDAEKNIMILNKARICAMEDLEKILSENKELQGQINILEMKLTETDARLKVATEEKVHVDFLEKQLENLQKELSEKNDSEECKVVGNENLPINTKFEGAGPQTNGLTSLSEELSVLRKENGMLNTDIQVLKSKVTDVDETYERMLILERERRSLEMSLKEVESKLLAAQEDVSNLSALKAECETLREKVDNLEDLLEQTSTQAGETVLVLQQNHELRKKVEWLEKSLEELKLQKISSENIHKYNDVLQEKIRTLEERAEKSDKEVQFHVQFYQESIIEFQKTLERLREERKRRSKDEPVADMPWEFWSQLSLTIEGWLLEKKITLNDAKVLRKLTWKRDVRIHDAYLACKDKSENESISAFLRLISSETSSCLHIVHIAAEMAPVAKVGGLGDVVCGLSKALQKKGHLVEVVLPKYDILKYDRVSNLKVLDCVLESYFDGNLIENKVWVGTVEGIPAYFIEPIHRDKFFWRKKFYGEPDDFRRFSCFSRAALELLLLAGKKPDIIHCHDWQTAFVAPLYWDIFAPRGLDSARICFTCHNFEYQGKAHASDLRFCGLDAEKLNRPDRMQDDSEHEKVNSLKGAIVFSNIVTTVSPTYAIEVRTPEGGRGLQGILKHHANKFVGVINGIDTDLWNPRTDESLKFKYSAENLEGKMENKNEMRKLLNLSSVDASRPLVACITRLVPQKGVHLIRHAIYRTLELGGQFLLLGDSPVDHIQKEFEGIAKHFQDHPHIRLLLTFDEDLSRFIYAASDMFIIPSLFEPCGLTQMIAMRYGSIPIVRKTGGLNDSVFDVDDETIPIQFRNGFTFEMADEQGLNSALDRAFNYYVGNPMAWKQLVQKDMAIEFGWDESAAQYEELYSNSVARARAAAANKT